jgi:predicted nucleic acid-binding protein
MATYVLDTSILIDVLNDKKERRLLLHNLVSQGHLLACCPINVAEVYAGMRPKEERDTDILLKSLQYYPIAFAVARLAGLMKHDYSRRGKTLSIADSTIAAVAIHYQLQLITDNTNDFPMHELQLYPLS